MAEAEAPLVALHDARHRFLALVADIRPDLHRYCARMTGSVADGEDVVQEALARAYYALSELEELPALRPWLFQIAHNRALDHLRRYERRMREPLEAIADISASPEADPEDAFAREQATAAAISRFVELAPAQRSAVVLKDVLGHSVDEIAELLALSESAVKAALHRGRERLRALATASIPDQEPRIPVNSAGVARYAALFNARDWDGVRALLAEDVRLDLVSRVQRAGRRDVSSYFTNYSATSDWFYVPAVIDGREVLSVFRAREDASPDYLVALGWRGDQIVEIKDYRYVPYILREGALSVSRESARTCRD